MSTYDAVRKMWSANRIETAEDLDLCLENFRILFAYHSGKIENRDITYYDTREIFENGKVLNFTGNPRAIMEQQNQKLCYEFLKDKIVGKEPITLLLIQEIHRILAGGTYDEKRYVTNGERPGEFKKHDYITGIYEIGSPPDRVEQDLKELLDEMDGYSGEEILKPAAYFHVRFEYIHPFADGNGRTGRTLLNYYLLIHDEPPLIIYDEDKDGYYRALQAYDKDETIQPMIDFLIYETQKTWSAALEHVQGHTPKNQKRFDEIR